MKQLTLQEKIATAEHRTLRWVKGYNADFPDDGRWKILPLVINHIGYVKEVDYQCKYCKETFGGFYKKNKDVCFNCRKERARIRAQKRKKARKNKRGFKDER